MLSSDMLRTRMSRGRIYPKFCSPDARDSEEYALASDMIRAFCDARDSFLRKGDLHGMISEMEHGRDYKLVRGLRSLLERRSEFVMKSTHTGVAPADLRRVIFEESSRMGLATSDARRQSVLDGAARLCGIDSKDIPDAMWADLDENLVLGRFDAITAEDLLLWYNMSLAQTLLFSCTRLEFGIGGDDGSYWKTVLRAVKMYGLMYMFENDSDENGKNRGARYVSCALEGPVSVFKMTTRYGTSFARMLPVIARTPEWYVDAAISKKTGSSGARKMYRFEMSHESARGYLRDVCADPDAKNNNSQNQVYDSAVERMFADAMRTHIENHGWRMTREPAPIASENMIMIPDFVFERLGRRVYLEIMGFWTPDYIRRKVAKLHSFLGCENNTDTSRNGGKSRGADLLVGIDSALLCSGASGVRDLPGVFVFERNKISAKPILERLVAIDSELEKDAVSATIIASSDLRNDGAILIRNITEKYAVPESAIPEMIECTAPGAYLKAGPYMIPVAIASKLSAELENNGVKMFADACDVMSKNGIPDSAHADLLARLDYDVVWLDLDPANAQIMRKSR